MDYILPRLNTPNKNRVDNKHNTMPRRDAATIVKITAKEVRAALNVSVSDSSK